MNQSLSLLHPKSQIELNLINNTRYVSSVELWNKIWLLTCFNSEISENKESYSEYRYSKLIKSEIELEIYFQRKPEIQRHIIIYSLEKNGNRKQPALEIKEEDIVSNIQFSLQLVPIFKINQLFSKFRSKFREIKMMERKLLKEVSELDLLLKESEL